MNTITPTRIKQITVVSKSEGMKMAKEFDGFCSIETYCDGPYLWRGTEEAYIGKEHSVSSRILALWVEKRTDEQGDYGIFKCVIDRN